MKQVSCFFNSPYLGGAERSFGLQAKDLQKEKQNLELAFYIPFFEDPQDAEPVVQYLKDLGFKNSQIFYYRYSPLLYQLSRKSGISSFLWPIQVSWGLLITLRYLSQLKMREPDIWWVGGNKVGFVVYLLGLFSSYKGTLLWHFRDYPYRKGFFSLIWKLFKLPHNMNLEAVGNSFDVSKEISRGGQVFSKVHTLYNPVSSISFHVTENGPLQLATASMFAPWKGIHQLIFFALLYEKELKSLGIDKFVVYGDEIYKTKGAHTGYRKSIRQLQKKFNSKFIDFKGLKSPDEIFKETDIFIHGSLDREPFGRVILEAYKGGAALISTGLGGSRELIDEGETGLIIAPYDLKGLYNSVERLVSEERFRFVQAGAKKASSIENLYKAQLNSIF